MLQGKTGSGSRHLVARTAKVVLTSDCPTPVSCAVSVDNSRQSLTVSEFLRIDAVLKLDRYKLE